ncbi:hypothetical protein, partial [Bacteroides caccae]|uniref:hypothetical protein n=1 Tax=Bacteroides caccae TaxID=47678 RepID=UPI0032EFC897
GTFELGVLLVEVQEVTGYVVGTHRGKTAVFNSGFFYVLQLFECLITFISDKYTCVDVVEVNHHLHLFFILAIVVIER